MGCSQTGWYRRELVSKIETGRVKPKAELVCRIAQILGVRPEQLQDTSASGPSDSVV
jgi:transcriptional regulator with XRE-family HTH domain